MEISSEKFKTYVIYITLKTIPLIKLFFYLKNHSHTWRRNRDNMYSVEVNGTNILCTNQTEDDDDDSGESDEKNEGNPYTIWKNKYKQNWLWNHFVST